MMPHKVSSHDSANQALALALSPSASAPQLASLERLHCASATNNQMPQML